jgi:hypothetical protein
MYDPLVGRFLEEDPLDFAPGDPNLFRYVHNNPTNATDPSGMEEIPVPEKLTPQNVSGGYFDTFVGGITRTLDGHLTASIAKYNGHRGITISYKGVNADKALFVQMGQRTVTLVEMGKNGYQINRDLVKSKYITLLPVTLGNAAGGGILATTDPKKPNWSLDNVPEEESPFYNNNSKTAAQRSGIVDVKDDFFTTIFNNNREKTAAKKGIQYQELPLRQAWVFDSLDVDPILTAGIKEAKELIKDGKVQCDEDRIKIIVKTTFKTFLVTATSTRETTKLDYYGVITWEHEASEEYKPYQPNWRSDDTYKIITGKETGQTVSDSDKKIVENLVSLAKDDAARRMNRPRLDMPGQWGR